MPDDGAAPREYREKLNRIMSRLRAGSGLGLLRLSDGEYADLMVISDIGEWHEVELHRVKKDRRNYLCRDVVGEQCPWCAEGIPTNRKVAFAVKNLTIDQVQIVLWGTGADSPLTVLGEAYRETGQPMIGMVIRVRRRGTGKDTRYPTEYKDWMDSVEVEAPGRQEILETIANIFKPRDEDDD